MEDYSEEQSGELETLRCIYSEQEFTEISDDPPCFKINVQATDSSDDKEVTVSVEVQFSFPPTYPDVPPEMEVVSNSGLEPKHVEEIETFLQEQALENVGMVMVFTLVSNVQDKLGEVLENFKKEKEEEIKRKEEELKREEEAKFHGTVVTRESFLEWRKKFEEEMNEKFGNTKDSSLAGQSNRLTGRQMFERDATLALSDARFLAEGSSVSESVVSQDTVEVDESLFQDLEDLQLEET